MKVDLVVGARPQFVKAAPFFWERHDFPGLELRIVHTGQHFEPNMSEAFFRDLGIPDPEQNLGISGGSHSEMTGTMMIALERYFQRSESEYVIVFGDTNSTLAGVLAATKLAIPVGHVEAGLRSRDRSMPEEINRIVADHLAIHNFAPTENARGNLRYEGLVDSTHLVGDVMYDVVCWLMADPERVPNFAVGLGLQSDGYVLASIHRQQSTGSALELKSRLDFIESESGEDPVVLLMHPRLRKSAEEFGLNLDRFITLNPVGYLEMASLLRSCRLVLTDSGGLQKEAFFHQKKCITLRDQTEWPETLASGLNSLWKFQTNEPVGQSTFLFGNGRAARQILSIVSSHSSL